MKNITATVMRGKNRGALLTPHRYKDGSYKLSKGGNTNSHAINVEDYAELENWLQRGYGLRMSCAGIPPSIFSLKNLAIK